MCQFFTVTSIGSNFRTFLLISSHKIGKSAITTSKQISIQTYFMKLLATNNNRLVVGVGNFFVLDSTNGHFHQHSVSGKRLSNIKQLGNYSNDSTVFIECRNLNKTTKNLIGTLIAFKHKDHFNNVWNLAVVLDMNLDCSLITIFQSPVTGATREFVPKNLAYVSEYFSTFLCIDLSDNSKFEINYLNTVDGNFLNLPEKNRRCPFDSCWQHGDSPDEVLIYKDFPLTWRDSLTEYKMMCGNDSHLIFHNKTGDEEDTKMTANTILKVCLEIESTLTLTNLTTNMGQPTKGLFYVPFVTEKKTNTCQTIKFALIGQKELRALIGSGNRSIEEHNTFLECNKVGDVCDIDVYSFDKDIDTIIFTTKMSKPNECKKTSKVLKSTGLDNIDFDKEEMLLSRWDDVGEEGMPYSNEWNIIIEDIIATFGNNGYGHRGCTKVSGLNVYSGKRKYGEKVHHSPLCGQSMLKTSEFTRQGWNYSKMPIIQKIFNILTTHAGHHAMNCDKQMDKLLIVATGKVLCDIRRHCRVSILTCGNNKVLGFGCTDHTDMLDRKNGNIQSHLVKKLKEYYLVNNKKAIIDNIWQNAEKLISTFGIGTSTTCGYLVHVDDDIRRGEHIEVMAFFVLSGLQSCLRLKSNLYHFFYGYTFSHLTSIPVMVMNEIVYYNHDSLKILAWGGGG